VNRFALLLCFAALPALSADLPEILRAVEQRYNTAKTLQVEFQETYRIPGRPARTESGTLYLRKPGRMRWVYTSPADKLFLSDGETMFLYTPANGRVEKMKVKESEDMRAPLAFLLGRLNLSTEFKRIEARFDQGHTWLVAFPKSEDYPYSRVEFEIGPGSEIRQVKVMGHDRSVLEFLFSNEKRNPPLAADLFRFQMPPGAEFVGGAR
jgi:outer membrane lipoprotein carrier protein